MSIFREMFCICCFILEVKFRFFLNFGVESYIFWFLGGFSYLIKFIVIFFFERERERDRDRDREREREREKFIFTFITIVEYAFIWRFGRLLEIFVRSFGGFYGLRDVCFF